MRAGAWEWLDWGRSAGRSSSEPVEPQPSAGAAAVSPLAETLSERELAAVREALPAIHERTGQIIQHSFDAESFKRLLTNHPEFRKE